MKHQRILYNNCPLCGSIEFFRGCTSDCATHPLLDPKFPWSEEFEKEIKWMVCNRCGHVFTEGYFPTEALETLMRATPPGQNPNENYMAYRMVAAELIETLHGAGLGTHNRWLDVGIGNGAVMTTAAEYGFRVVGLDLRDRKYDFPNFDVRQCELGKLPQEEMFDVISLLDVVEHVPYPRDILKDALSHLADDGIMLISMPNTDSHAWRVLEEAGNPYWGEIEHYHNFSFSRLESLLEEFGLKVGNYRASRRYIASMELTVHRS